MCQGQEYSMEETFAFLCMVNSTDYETCSEEGKSRIEAKFVSFMNGTSKQFAEQKHEVPLPYLRLLLDVLPNVPSSILNPTQKQSIIDWHGRVRQIIKQILQCRSLDDDTRHLLFTLSSTLAVQLDKRWLIEDEEFSLLLLRLSVVELQLALQNLEAARWDTCLSCLALCHSFLDVVLSYDDAPSEACSNAEPPQHFSISENLACRLNCVLAELADSFVQLVTTLPLDAQADAMDEKFCYVMCSFLCTFLLEGYGVFPWQPLENCLRILVKYAINEVNQHGNDLLAKMVASVLLRIFDEEEHSRSLKRDFETFANQYYAK